MTQMGIGSSTVMKILNLLQVLHYQIRIMLLEFGKIQVMHLMGIKNGWQ